MKNELQAELQKRYPNFYREPMQGSAQADKAFGFGAFHLNGGMPFDDRGVECGDGWFDLIDRLSCACESEIQTLVAQGLPKDVWPRIAQIKEKFGGLRFYVRGPMSGSLRAQIQQAQTETSFHICECCGASGKLRTDRRLYTRCDSCAAAGIT